MEINRAKPRTSRWAQLKTHDPKLLEKYPHSLQFFKIPPGDNITLEEFEELAVERLKILKAVEDTGLKHVKNTPDYARVVEAEIKKTKLKNILLRNPKQEHNQYELTDTALEARRNDQMSHFILRLAYCRTDDLRRWFIQQEINLFRFRFLREEEHSMKQFIDSEVNDIDISPISIEDKAKLKDLLMVNTTEMTDIKFGNNDFYRIPFAYALELVSRRKVYLNDGYAYVPSKDVISIILPIYRSQLSHALAQTARYLPNIEEDKRLLPLLRNLSKRYLGSDYSCKAPVGHVTADMIPLLAQQFFPPCMSMMQAHLQKEHHLKHGGRMQYGLFLKGIGLSLEQALKFWRSEFTKGPIDGDKFDKAYGYNIRHNYGKEGKRANYTPYSCLKIIMSNHPGQGDMHGCPFRHSDRNILQQNLESMKIPKAQQDEILQKVKETHYHVACGVYFKAKHRVNDAPVIQHPNQYYEESRKISQGGRDSYKKEVTKAVIVPSQAATKPPNQSQADKEGATASDPFEKDEDIVAYMNNYTEA